MKNVPASINQNRSLSRNEFWLGRTQAVVDFDDRVASEADDR